MMGATFVARSFSGDKKQLVPLVKAAIAHPGAAFIDVISPCVAFNNHAGSTKSYDYMREHNEVVNRLDFWPNRSEITVDYNEGEVIDVPQHDGSIVRLRKTHAAKGEVITGLLYVHPEAEDLHTHLHTVDTAFNKMGVKDLCPGAAALEKINASMR